MAGLIKEGDEIASETEDSPVRDAGLIVAAQKVEHYEISGYGSARTHAQLLGHTNAVSLLEQTLNEEKMADTKLGEIAEEANEQAHTGSNGASSSRARHSTSPRASQSAKK